MKRAALLAAACCLALAAATPCAAEEAPFYAGKSIQMVVGFDVGGGYDLYARTVARYFSKHMPGNPSMVVQNMPGAGGILAANHLYTRAARDGLTMGVIQGTLVYAQVGKSRNVQFDMRRYGWLGSANDTSNTCVFSKHAGIQSANDLLTKTVVIGGSGGSTEFVPSLLNALVGTHFKIVKGYKSTRNILPAIESGEVDGMCGWGWDSARVNGRDYLDRGIISVGLECANERNPELAAKGVPFMMDLVKDEENKKILSFLFSYLVFIRPFVTPPEIPPERLKALQEAFAATLKDADLLKEAEKSGTEIRYVLPQRANAALSQIVDAPDAVKARALAELQKAGWEGLRR
jgi:tripartite-type tricarboxylate transporter receptor subunit TctC